MTVSSNPGKKSMLLFPDDINGRQPKAGLRYFDDDADGLPFPTCGQMSFIRQAMTAINNRLDDGTAGKKIVMGDDSQ